MAGGGEGVDDVAELEHHRQLEAWVEGVYPVEAAARLLIRGGYAQTWRPWIRTVSGQGPGHWVDLAVIADELGGLSGGQRRLLLIAVSLGTGTPVNLSDSFSTLDRGSVSLVLAAVGHAAGTPGWSNLGRPLLVDEHVRAGEPG